MDIKISQLYLKYYKFLNKFILKHKMKIVVGVKRVLDYAIKVT